MTSRIEPPVSDMLTTEEQKAVMSRAYVPEHSTELMTSISGGEPFLFEDYFCCRTPRGIIVVGYPLEHDFRIDRFEKVLKDIVRLFRPVKLSLIAPEVPMSFDTSFVERSTDNYYTLDLPASVPSGTLKRMLKKARATGIVEHATELTEAHRELATEFVQRMAAPQRIQELLFRMWNYVGRAKDAAVINAWDLGGKLAAFYVVDLAPTDFSTYIIGCHSKLHYIPGASDLLMSELVNVSTSLEKRFIHLGLGVNQGIRTFKEKWGGVPTRPYELCEMALRRTSLLDALLGTIGR